MQNYIVVRSQKTENRTVLHEVDPGNGDLKLYKYSAVRGGLSWPTAKSPAYYCIVGEEFLEYIDHSDFKRQRGKLTLFCEQEFSGLSLNEFFTKLTDDATLFRCDYIYTDMDEESSNYAEIYRNYTFREKISIGSLAQAPYVDNFRLGLALIKDWMKAGLLDIPENSIVYDQLKKITLADLLEEMPEIKFYAINGLRFAIGAFEKYPVSHYVYPIRRDYYSGPASWMH